MLPPASAAPLRRAVEEIDRKKARRAHQLEDRDDPGGSVFRTVRERLSGLTVTVTDETLTARPRATGGAG